MEQYAENHIMTLLHMHHPCSTDLGKVVNSIDSVRKAIIMFSQHTELRSKAKHMGVACDSHGPTTLPGFLFGNCNMIWCTTFISKL